MLFSAVTSYQKGQVLSGPCYGVDGTMALSCGWVEGLSGGMPVSHMLFPRH